MEKKFVCLEGLQHGNRFYTMNHPEPTKLANGEVVYKIIGYADSEKEALTILYGETHNLFENRKKMFRDYIAKFSKHLSEEDIDKMAVLLAMDNSDEETNNS